MKSMRSPLFLLAVLACATVTTAQDAATPEIRVTGQATLKIKPDQAEIDLGVVTQASSAKAAAETNATKLDAVLTALRDIIGDKGKIETTNYSLRPNYTRPRDGGEATIASFTATNTVRASGVAIDATGELIDAAIEAGANNVQRLNFTLADAEAPRLRALGDAARQARAKAEALADALGLEIVRVLSVAEGTPTVVRPYAPRAAMMQAEAAPTTPVEPGAVEVHASVTLRVLVTPK
jgi:uncharacterized protein YggE